MFITDRYLVDVCDDYDPISIPSGHHELDFLPLALQTWYLALALAFFVICGSGAMIVVVLSQTSPERFHLQNATYQRLFAYSPMIAGSLTSLWWLSIVRTYWRILPYIAMAGVPIGPDKSLKRIVASNNMALARYSARDSTRCKDWTTLLVDITQGMVVILLIPSKAAFLQVEQTDKGWSVQVSFFFGCVAASLYILLISSTLFLLIQLRHITTGLKWDPASLASQFTLLTYFDPLNFFKGLEFEWKLKETRRRTKIWGLSDYGALRLGYWKHRKSGCIVHGIRILPHDHGMCPRKADAWIGLRFC